jgi:hypothetical protein
VEGLTWNQTTRNVPAEIVPASLPGDISGGIPLGLTAETAGFRPALPECTKAGKYRGKTCASSVSLLVAVAAAPAAEGTNHNRNRDEQDEENHCASAVVESAVESEQGMTMAEDDEVNVS